MLPFSWSMASSWLMLLLETNRAEWLYLCFLTFSLPICGCQSYIVQSTGRVECSIDVCEFLCFVWDALPAGWSLILWSMLLLTSSSEELFIVGAWFLSQFQWSTDNSTNWFEQIGDVVRLGMSGELIITKGYWDIELPWYWYDEVLEILGFCF